MEEQLNIQINGEMMPLPTGCTVSQLVEQMGLTKKRFAVELNLNIVPKSEHDQMILTVGDIVEVVHAIGGG